MNIELDQLFLDQQAPEGFLRQIYSSSNLAGYGLFYLIYVMSDDEMLDHINRMT